MTTGLACRWLLALVLAGQCLAALASSDAELSQGLFEQLLEESGLQFSLPPCFKDIKPEANPVLHNERALRHNPEGLEIRYIIRPLGRL